MNIANIQLLYKLKKEDGDVVGHVPESRIHLISYSPSYDGNVGFYEVSRACKTI